MSRAIKATKITVECLKHNFTYNVITADDEYHKSFIGRFVRICLKCDTCDVEQFYPNLGIRPWMGIHKTESVENDIVKWRAEHFAGIKWVDKLY